MTSVYINALLQACLEFAAHAPQYVLINSRNFNNGLFEFLNSHDTPPEHTVFQEPPQEKIWYCKVGRPSRPREVAETREQFRTFHEQPYYFVLCGLLLHPAEYEGLWGQCQAVVSEVQQSLPT